MKNEHLEMKNFHCSLLNVHSPVGGGKETRTPDIQLAKLALYQLSYAPPAG
jgi:hypothetical protein